jgi:hypothetical protein
MPGSGFEKRQSVPVKPPPGCNTEASAIPRDTEHAAAEHVPIKSRRESSMDMILSFYFETALYLASTLRGKTQSDESPDAL